MLVLTRKNGERILIGENIVIQVLDIDRGKIRLGITCPREIPIMREELVNPPKQEATSGAAAQGK